MNPQQQRIQQRIEIGERRILNILRKHSIATMRMLEQKISDAGPNPQRVDPHILTKDRNSLIKQGILQHLLSGGTQWHYLTEGAQDLIQQRFLELTAIHTQTERRDFTTRMGDTAEIAVLKAMQRSELQFIGHFADLDKHGDDKPYAKSDPIFFSGMPIIGGKLDYILFNADATGMGIEIKNTREWVYPDKDVITDLLNKCLQIDVIPVLIARRIHYTTFAVLNACGGIIHQSYNQLYPSADATLAELVRDRNKLGYFDVRVGNEPDARLLRFFQSSIPSVAQEARNKFEEHKDLISEYVQKKLPYHEFARRVRGQQNPYEDDWDPDF